MSILCLDNNKLVILGLFRHSDYKSERAGGKRWSCQNIYTQQCVYGKLLVYKYREAYFIIIEIFKFVE